MIVVILVTSVLSLATLMLVLACTVHVVSGVRVVRFVRNWKGELHALTPGIHVRSILDTVVHLQLPMDDTFRTVDAIPMHKTIRFDLKPLALKTQDQLVVKVDTTMTYRIVDAHALVSSGSDASFVLSDMAKTILGTASRPCATSET
jgi:regulator of protease activity HflC (stomatin/prohibitin superfamily)